jgi:hypothetical protein
VIAQLVGKGARAGWVDSLDGAVRMMEGIL